MPSCMSTHPGHRKFSVPLRRNLCYANIFPCASSVSNATPRCTTICLPSICLGICYMIAARTHYSRGGRAIPYLPSDVFLVGGRKFRYGWRSSFPGKASQYHQGQGGTWPPADVSCTVVCDHTAFEVVQPLQYGNAVDRRRVPRSGK
jgi:hypothetical protein